jgi:hypothetical protein
MSLKGDVEERYTDRDWKKDKSGDGYTGMVDFC